MKVLLLSDADHRLKPARILHYRAGSTYSVPRAIGEALIARGAAVAIPPRRSARPQTTPHQPPDRKEQADAGT